MKRIFGIFLIDILLFSCSPKVAPVEKSASPTASNLVTAKELWQVEWEKALKEAKKESKVVVHIYSGMPQTFRYELLGAFRNKYGLDIEMIAGRGAEIPERLLMERSAGIYAVDLYMMSGLTAISRLKPHSVLQPFDALLILPEVKDPKVWFERRLPYLDEDKLVFSPIAYVTGTIEVNYELVGKEGLLSYKDLLNPKWKGKIMMADPTAGGAAGQWFSSTGVRVLGTGYLKELAKQEIVFSRDLRLLAEWLARGKYPISLGLGGAETELVKAGAPISSLMLKEGGYLNSGGSGNLAFYKDSPHPNAAKVFINWILTREGQTMLSRGVDNQSARIDVPTDFLTQIRVRQPGVPYFNTINEQHQLKMTEDQLLSKEIFNIK